MYLMHLLHNIAKLHIHVNVCMYIFLTPFLQSVIFPFTFLYGFTSNSCVRYIPYRIQLLFHKGTSAWSTGYILCNRFCSKVANEEFTFWKHDPGHYSAMMTVKGRKQRRASKFILKYAIKAKDSFQCKKQPLPKETLKPENLKHLIQWISKGRRWYNASSLPRKIKIFIKAY